MAKTPEAAIKFMDALAPAATAKAIEEGKDIQALIDAQKGGFQLQPWDWEFYSEQVRKAKYDLDEDAGEAVLRGQQCAGERRLLRGEPAVRHHVQGAQGHSGLQPGCARLRGLRRGRQAAGAVVLRLLQARQQERRRVDEQLRAASRSCWARCR